MPLAHAKRIGELRTRVRHRRSSSTNTSRRAKSRTWEMHLRFADIEAALDLVKASIRLAAPALGAVFIDPPRAAENRFFGAFHLVASGKKSSTGLTARPTPRRPKVRAR